MKKCIYCKTADPNIFTSREHVILSSFGKFGSDTPTLHCVCDDCNSFFKKELDQGFSRDTLEGVTRYKNGIYSRQREFPKSVKFELGSDERYGKYAGALLGGYDPSDGKPLPIIPQFWIKNHKTLDWEKYKLEQIKEIDIKKDCYKDPTSGLTEMQVMGSSQKEYEEVLNELQKRSIPFKEKEKMGIPPFLQNIPPDGKVVIEGITTIHMSKAKQRALAKMIFNFATYYLGEEETMKTEWDKARKFIRYDEQTILCMRSNEPFWNLEETVKKRFSDDSYNMRIENRGGSVVGSIQFYNLSTFKFIMAENHSIPTEKEVAYRFTPGKLPQKGFKVEK